MGSVKHNFTGPRGLDYELLTPGGGMGFDREPGCTLTRIRIFDAKEPDQREYHFLQCPLKIVSLFLCRALGLLAPFYRALDSSSMILTSTRF
jgi:hypothetical protein